MVLTNDSIGYVASSFYIISLFPELYEVYKSRECKLTIYFLLFQILTTILFIVYDIFIDVIPLLVADSTLLAELLILVFLKLKCKKKPNYIIRASIV